MGVSYSGGYSTPRMDLAEAFMEHMGQSMSHIALAILPLFRTLRQAAKFPKLKRSSMLRSADVRRAPNGGYNEVGIEAVDDDYSCEERGLEGRVDDRHRAFYQNDFDLEMAVGNQVAEKIMLAREIDVQAMIQDPVTNWPSGNAALYTDVSAAPWDTATSNVIGHIQAAKEKVRRLTGMIPNALILGESQFQNLLQNDDILLRFPGAPRVTEEMIMSNLGPIFGIEKVLRGKTVRNTADEGLTEVVSDVWNDDYAMVAVVANENDPITTPCVGRTFLWTPDSASDLVAEQYRDEQKRGNKLRYRHDTDEVIIDSSYGHLLKID